MNRVSTPLTKAHTTSVWAFLRSLVIRDPRRGRGSPSQK